MLGTIGRGKRVRGLVVCCMLGDFPRGLDICGRSPPWSAAAELPPFLSRGMFRHSSGAWRWQKAEAPLCDVIHQLQQPDHVAVLLAKAVAPLPHSKARPFGPRREPVARVEKTKEWNSRTLRLG